MERGYVFHAGVLLLIVRFVAMDDDAEHLAQQPELYKAGAPCEIEGAEDEQLDVYVALQKVLGSIYDIVYLLHNGCGLSVVGMGVMPALCGWRGMTVSDSLRL